MESHQGDRFGGPPPPPPGFHRPPPPPSTAVPYPPPPADHHQNHNHHRHNNHHGGGDHGGGFAAGYSNYHYNDGRPHRDCGGGFAGDPNYHHHHDGRPHGDCGGGFAGDSNYHHPLHNPHYSNHNYSNHHHQHQKHEQSNHHYNHNHNHSEHPLQSNVEHNHGGFHGPPPPLSTPHPVRKRDFHHPGRDYIDGNSYVKLYVGFVSRTATEQDIRPLFEEFGRVVEVVLLWDKISGQQKGSCFVKYATTEEADRAIRALNNQHIFPGESSPMKIRYADGEMERLGTLEFKLYVGCLNKQALKKDVEEIFTPYGQVEDIYLSRDEWKQNRGFGFVKYSLRDMALAAIKALNGNYFMRGCDQPLIVRFADSKKPKTESRSNCTVAGSNFCSHPQESAVRPTQNLGGPLDQHMLPDNSYPSNSSASVQQLSMGSQPEAVSEMQNRPSPAPCFIQQPLQPLQKCSELPKKELQVLQETTLSSQELVSEMKTQLHQIQPSIEELKQQQDFKIGGKSQALSSSSTPSAAVVSPTVVVAAAVLVDLPDSNWSEHICPDGYRYYYNCITCESSWKKPGEFILFEQQLQKKQQFQKLSSEELPSLSHSQSHSRQKDSQTQGVQLWRELPHQKYLQQPSLSVSELVPKEAAATSVVGPTHVH